MNINDCYSILEISSDATYGDAKAAYRLMAQVWHPDKHSYNDKIHTKATNKLKEINAAWSTLEEYFKSVSVRESERKAQEEQERGREADLRAKQEQDRKQREANRRYKYTICQSCNNCNKMAIEILIKDTKCGTCGQSLSGHSGSKSPETARKEYDSIVLKKKTRREDLENGGNVVAECSSYDSEKFYNLGAKMQETALINAVTMRSYLVAVFVLGLIFAVFITIYVFN